MQFDVKTVNGLLGIDESYKAPNKMLQIMLNDDKRPELFRKFLEVSSDLNFDWFHEYFEDEQAERKSKKQDFTPDGIAQLMNGLVDLNMNKGRMYFETAAGTGGILIKRWRDDRIHDRVGNPLYDKAPMLSVFTYDPRNYWYQAEEMSDKAVPFLIFNMAIRGMNGIVVQCDSLIRKAKEVYFIRNDTNDLMKFSEVIKMSHSDEVAKACDIHEWVKEFD